MGRTLNANLCPIFTPCRLFKMITVQIQRPDKEELGTGIFMTVPWLKILWIAFALVQPHIAGIKSVIPSIEANVADNHGECIIKHRLRRL